MMNSKDDETGIEGNMKHYKGYSQLNENVTYERRDAGENWGYIITGLCVIVFAMGMMVGYMLGAM